MSKTKVHLKARSYKLILGIKVLPQQNLFVISFLVIADLCSWPLRVPLKEDSSLEEILRMVSSYNKYL